MNPKTANKLAIGTLYGIAGTIVLILALLLGYIIISGLPSELALSNHPSEGLYQRWWGWHSAF